MHSCLKKRIVCSIAGLTLATSSLFVYTPAYATNTETLESYRAISHENSISTYNIPLDQNLLSTSSHVRLSLDYDGLTTSSDDFFNSLVLYDANSNEIQGDPNEAITYNGVKTIYKDGSLHISVVLEFASSTLRDAQVSLISAGANLNTSETPHIDISYLTDGFASEENQALKRAVENTTELANAQAQTQKQKVTKTSSATSRAVSSRTQSTTSPASVTTSPSTASTSSNALFGGQANKQKLENTIKKAESFTAENPPTKGDKAIADAKQKAQTVMGNSNATQTEVDDIGQLLADAIKTKENERQALLADRYEIITKPIEVAQVGTEPNYDLGIDRSALPKDIKITPVNKLSFNEIQTKGNYEVDLKVTYADGSSKTAKTRVYIAEKAPTTAHDAHTETSEVKTATAQATPAPKTSDEGVSSLAVISAIGALISFIGAALFAYRKDKTHT